MQGQTASYVLTTVVTAPTSKALTTLGKVKAELNLTDGSLDQWIGDNIPRISDSIARHCNRIFGLAAWQDEFRPARGVWGEGVRGATNPLTLARWPLVNAAVVNLTGDTHGTTTIDNLSTTAGLAAGQLFFGSGIAVGATIASVGVASLVLNLPSGASPPPAATGVALNTGLSVVETVLGVPTTLVAGADFEIDAGPGLPGDEGAARLYRLNDNGNPRNWPAAEIIVIYQAGYVLPADGSSSATLPSDLEEAALLLMVARLKSRGRDPYLRTRGEPGLGQEQYWIGALPGASGALPPEVLGLVDKYRVPVIA